MKNLLKLFIVCIVFISITGCEDKPSAKQLYYAKIAGIQKELGSKVILIKDKQKFTKHINSIKNVIKESNKISFEDSESQGEQKIITQQADKVIKSLTNFRKAYIAMGNEFDEAKVNKYNKLQAEYSSNFSDLVVSIEQMKPTFESSDDGPRRDKIQEYNTEFDSFISFVTDSYNLKSKIIVRDDSTPSTKEKKELKEILSKIENSYKTLLNIKLGTQDEEIKKQKELKIAEIIKYVKETHKYIGNSNPEKFNRATEKLNAAYDEAYFTMLDYDLEIEPYINLKQGE